MKDHSDIHEAARRGDLEALHRLVDEEGVDVDSKNDLGHTPLITVALEASSLHRPVDPAVIRYLISKNADVEATVGNGSNERSTRQYYIGPGDTALAVVSGVGNLEIAKLLLEEGGANVNFSNAVNGNTALTTAARTKSGHIVVPTLLEYGANVNPRHNVYCDLLPPLLAACSVRGGSKVVGLLLEHGADVEANAAHGSSAAHYAASQDSDEATIRLLFERRQRPSMQCLYESSFDGYMEQQYPSSAILARTQCQD